LLSSSSACGISPKGRQHDRTPNGHLGSWGSDWPHPGLPDNNKPDDALLFDLMTEWAPGEATRNRILVTNPEVLYGFPQSA
jgi:hypothetical protein